MDHKQLLQDKNYEGIPGTGTINKTIHAYHSFKSHCLLSFNTCGIRYNKAAFDGPYGECGSVDVFGIWKNSVDEKRAKKYVRFLMEHYDFPLYHSPPGLESHLNAFYQSKYGMFTCFDTKDNIGKVRYNVEFINHWQRNKVDQKFTWYLAIAYGLANSKVKLEDLKDYKKNYREGTKYQNYLIKNPEHPT